MFKPINSYKNTLLLIADILSFEVPSSYLKQRLTLNKIDWDELVKLASSHLVLTTVYFRLKQKALLSYIPEDLETYLREISQINRNRNLALLEEIKSIADTFNANKIDYVFLKGAALLSGNFYQDIGERMVGDIDILVHKKQGLKAFELLKNSGYNECIKFNYDQKNFRHLPRQINSEKLGAVELHQSVLNTNYIGLIDNVEILKQKTKINNIPIPNEQDLNRITIFTSQINGNGFNFKQWDLKHLYDSLILKLDKDSNLRASNNKYIRDYLAKFQAIFNRTENNDTALKKPTRAYGLRIKYARYYQVLRTLKMIYYRLRKRVNLILSNKSYRHHIFKNVILKKR